MYKETKKRPGSVIRAAPSSVTLGVKGRKLKVAEGSHPYEWTPVIARSSKEGHRVDALALRADERRDKLRKAAGSCK